MSTMYEVTVRRDGRWWFVYIPELDTAGQARTLKEVDDVAREVVGLYLNVDPASVDVHVTVELPDEARRLWTEANDREDQARASVASAAQMRREAVRSLTDAGFSQSDAARALGLSPQRVSQLIHG